jgi:hypothetical protein
MDTTELDSIVTNAPGSEIDLPFFAELKANLLLALLADGTNAKLPVYANNAAALANGAVVGSLYAKSTGEVYTVISN